MNKMYEYLKNHAYISYNKKSTYQFELSEERAECIANKYDSLTYELQKENKKQKEVIDKAIEYISNKKAIINTDVIRIFDLFKIDEQGYTNELLDILKGGGINE